MNTKTGAIKTVDGRKWECFRAGIGQTYWEYGGARAGWNSGRATYWCSAYGTRMGDRYRTLESAMRAAWKATGEAYP